MSFFAAGRLSDSPFVDSVWHGQSVDDITLMCPADGRWNLCLTKLQGRVQVSIEGPISRAIPKTHVDGVDWMVIKFKLGVVMPFLSAIDIVDSQAMLPGGAHHRSFWLHGATWELPNFENADTFVARLVKDEVVLWEPVVKAALDDRPPPLSPRTIRHRFLRNIGLTQGHIRQIEQARDASTLLQNGASILDVTHQMGYADQPHLSRALKRFMGYTPMQTIQIKPFL